MNNDINILYIEIKSLQDEIERNFTYIKLARNAIKYHKGLDDLIYFCNNGKYPKEEY